MSDVEDLLKQRGVALVRRLANTQAVIREKLIKASELPGGADHSEKYAEVARDIRLVHDEIKSSMKSISASWRDKSGSRVHGDADVLREGKHEWIPTNMLPYVILLSARWDDLRWLGLAEALRCATPGLVYRAHSSITGTAKNPVVTLAGHVGGLYDKDGVALSTGMPGWHDGLRTCLTDNLNLNRNDMATFTSDLFFYANQTLWAGGITDAWKRALPCNFFRDDKCTKSWGPTLGEMGEEIARRKKVALTLIDHIGDAFTNGSPGRFDNGALAQRLISDKVAEAVYHHLKTDTGESDLDTNGE